MKKLIYYAAMIVLLASCQDERAVTASSPDSATKLSGTYKLIFASYFNKDISSSYSMGTLSVSKVNPTVVKGEVVLGSPSDPNYNHTISQWVLREITKDSIIIDTDGYYTHDKVFLSVADASLKLRFIRQ